MMKVINRLREKYGVEIKLYLVMFVFLFGIFFAMNMVYKDSLDETSRTVNAYIFQKVSDAVTDTLSEIHSRYLSLINNKKVEAFFETNADNLLRHEATYALMDDFKESHRFSRQVDLCFLYLKERDAVLSHNGIVSSNVFFNMYFDPEKMDYELWRESLLTRSNSGYVDMYCRMDGVEAESYAFVFPVLDYEMQGVGVIVSSKEHLLAGVRELDWDAKCDVFVYDMYNSLAISACRLKVEGLPLSFSKMAQFNEKGYALNMSEIQVSDEKWHVATVVPESVLGERMVLMSIFLAGIIILCMIVLWCLVRFLIRMHYRPVKQFAGLLGETGSLDKYDELYARVSDLVDRNKQLLKNSQQHEERLNALTLYQLLRGIITERELSEKKISFGHEQFAVLLFDIDDIDVLFAEDSTMSSFERRYHLSSIIECIFKELFEKQGMYFYLAEYENFTTSLINLPSGVSIERVKQAAEIGVESINQRFGIRLSYALSSVVQDVESIAEAYSQALDTLSYKHVVKSEGSLYYGDVSGLSKGKYIFNLYTEQMLVQWICVGNQIAATEMLAKLFDTLRGNGYSLDYIRYVIVDIASTITKCAEEVLGDHSDWSQVEELYRDIYAGKDLDSLKAKVTDYAAMVCQAALGNVHKKQNTNKPKEHLDSIVKYVQANFRNEDINVTIIADYFGLTPQYIIRIFKDYANISLLDYINSLRIEYVKELKKTGQYTVKDLSKMAGFNNERTYYRVLKKYQS